MHFIVQCCPDVVCLCWDALIRDLLSLFGTLIRCCRISPCVQHPSVITLKILSKGLALAG